MKSICKHIIAAAILLLGAFGAAAQNSLPAPGSGGSFTPNVAPVPTYGPSYGPGPVWGNPGWDPGYWGPSSWNSPWYDGWNYSPTVIVAPSTSDQFQNQGTEKVIACGYDAQGVWRVLPLYVSYAYTGDQYNVNVLNAWNPWTDSWDKGVDVQAFHCSHYLRNVLYKYYCNLSTGTFYFNL